MSNEQDVTRKEKFQQVVNFLKTAQEIFDKEKDILDTKKKEFEDIQ